MIRTTILYLLIATAIFGQSKNDFTGSLMLDQSIAFRNTSTANLVEDQIPTTASKKSPLLAALASAAIPGAGEFYTENYFKSAVFFALEAAAITVGLIYDNKGNVQTKKFESFANKHWNVSEYANWTVNNATRLNTNIDTDLLNIYDNNGKVIWSKLNELERAIGGWFSHQIDPYGSQQYYELIGKYEQFTPGWDDFSENPNDPFNFGDRLTDNYYYYSKERGKANEFYNIASKAVLVVVANHFISAIDAAFSAKIHNNKIAAQVSLEKLQLGFEKMYYPSLNISYTF
ncbi:MAG: hypothetical protein KJ799_15115 [Bacteroidetes bacterium]|nr:hypothetical protein [Bacteroidota bacterium]MBU1677615.1 hypothetical protein [Bacteroidota bacterium]MBU2508034.1 hypothetical protein [Bacteroidota bacterium]